MHSLLKSRHTCDFQSENTAQLSKNIDSILRTSGNSLLRPIDQWFPNFFDSRLPKQVKIFPSPLPCQIIIILLICALLHFSIQRCVLLISATFSKLLLKAQINSKLVNETNPNDKIKNYLLLESNSSSTTLMICMKWSRTKTHEDFDIL